MVIETTFELGADKSPNPYSFPISLFKNYWHIVEHDVFKLSSGFHKGSVNLMFNHALELGILYGVPLDNWGKMCHLQYADNFLNIIAAGLEDLIIIKLILFLLKECLDFRLISIKPASLTPRVTTLPMKPRQRPSNAQERTLDNLFRYIHFK